MVVDSTLFTYLFYKSRRKIMRNIILRSLNTENISNSLFFEELYILGTFEIRSNKDIFGNVGNS